MRKELDLVTGSAHIVLEDSSEDQDTTFTLSVTTDDHAIMETLTLGQLLEVKAACVRLLKHKPQLKPRVSDLYYDRCAKEYWTIIRMEGENRALVRRNGHTETNVVSNTDTYFDYGLQAWTLLPFTPEELAKFFDKD